MWSNSAALGKVYVLHCQGGDSLSDTFTGGGRVQPSPLLPVHHEDSPASITSAEATAMEGEATREATEQLPPASPLTGAAPLLLPAVSTVPTLSAGPFTASTPSLVQTPQILNPFAHVDSVPDGGEESPAPATPPLLSDTSATSSTAIAIPEASG